MMGSMGLAADYPMDAVITARFRRQGLCSRVEGERMIAFTNTADPVFIFGAVAVGLTQPGCVSAGEDGLANGVPVGLRRHNTWQEYPWTPCSGLWLSLPLAAVAHSFHVEALADSRLRTDPQFQHFSMIELNELHHQVSALGVLLRLQMGDPAALTSLGMNLAGFLQNRQAARALAGSLPADVTRHPAVQALMNLTQQSNRQISTNWPALQQTLAVTRGPAPGPMLVGLPR